MIFDPKPIVALYKAQPFKYKEFMTLSLWVYIFGAISSSLIFTKSPLDKLALKVINEQLAPAGIELFCSLGILFFTFMIVAKGPISNYESRITKAFIYISKFGLGLLFTYVSLMLASISAIFVTGYIPSDPFNVGTLLRVTISSIISANIIFIYFVLLMANGKYFPNFQKNNVVLTYRILSMIFLIAFLGRSILALYFAALHP